MQTKTLSKREQADFAKEAELLHGDCRAFRKRDNFDFFLYLVIVLLVAFSVRLFIFEPVRVSGASMETTLWDGERMFVEKVSLWFTEPERGEIVICRYPNDPRNIVKRIVAMPGETVEIRWGVLYVNGKPLDESAYWEGPIQGNYGPAVVPEGHVFVMGDNRLVSLDSRSAGVGPIPFERIIGRVHYVILPFNAIRKV